MPDLYAVSFGSTDDPGLDAELIEIEDSEHTLDVIAVLCRRYDVYAQLYQRGRCVLELARDGAQVPIGSFAREPRRPSPFAVVRVGKDVPPDR